MVGVLAVVGSWEVVQTGKLRTHMNELESDRRLQQQREQLLQQQINQEHARAEELAAQVQQHAGSAPVASLMHNSREFKSRWNPETTILYSEWNCELTAVKTF